jgi:Tol biopolymer transport system component
VCARCGPQAWALISSRVLADAEAHDVLERAQDMVRHQLLFPTAGITDEIEVVIETALAKDVEERYQSAKELLNALKRVKKCLQSADRPAASAAQIASSSEEIPGRIDITRLTSSGKVADAAISPDGRYVVHSVDEGGAQSLWVRQVNTNSNVEIVPPAEVSYRGLTFSPDGDYVYYVSVLNSTRMGILHKIPVLGGASRRLIEDVDTPVTVSPDGKQMAFIRVYPETAESVLIVAGTDGTGERKLAARKQPDSFPASTTEERAGPAWSPDGKVIACGTRSVDQAGAYHQIVTVAVSDGTVTPISSRRWYHIRRLAWLADGSGVLTTAAEQVGSYLSHQVWLVSYPDGAARKITNDLNNALWQLASIHSRAASPARFSMSREPSILPLAPCGLLAVGRCNSWTHEWASRTSGATDSMAARPGRSRTSRQIAFSPSPGLKTASDWLWPAARSRATPY